ncbi:unnamed protein product (macronuclear) [Paramecium tetraurelia]|uniref:Peroxisome membrane anchor protein Pex14p N-terminal domain-containing protein n=1 Tax=Paramecium tetraurelia TaxID=5888 RepID=A0CPG8_PARTE|nr:uncharacterized protein GSPATT00009077001 [Paramecium tetraurelia]CAK72685.1 unnamed protein product [Paramecium tetraurelia]|eukprot:XP_001440082.1 hypothetical protein (macronuclear) [Paramecium tetraurelia strain d4-2]
MSKQTKQEKEKDEKDKRIAVAINFINTPNLQNVPRSELEKFLKKKGLSDSEITEAFDKAKQQKEELKAKEDEKEKDLVSKLQQYGGIPQQNQASEKFINPQELKDFVDKAKISNLISIRNRGVTTIYEQILGLNNLQILIISNNKIQIIPQSIKNLTNLKVFHASCCNLQDHNIENEFFELTSLQELNMAKNQLSNIDRFTSLTELVLLDLSNNEIFRIPQNVDNLKKLKLLSLRDNHLTYLPVQLKQLNALKKLYLDQNALEDPHRVLKQNNPELIFQQGIFEEQHQ